MIVATPVQKERPTDYDLQVARYNATVLVQVLKAPLGLKKKRRRILGQKWNFGQKRRGLGGGWGGGGVEEHRKSMLQR